MKREFDEDVTQASMVSGGQVSIFGNKNPITKKREDDWYDQLFNLTEDINEYKKSYNLEDAQIRPEKYKRDVKAFIKKELADIGIEKYQQYFITKEELDEHRVSIKLTLWNIKRDNPRAYELINYNKEELDAALQVYIDSIIKHFKELGIDIHSITKSVDDLGWRNCCRCYDNI